MGWSCTLICGNYATHNPEVKKWLLRRLRFDLPFTPTSSLWMNLVERWFAELTNRQGPPLRAPPRHRTRSRHPQVDQHLER
jgi:hypothetical protein